jgi:hypothetical protein
VRSCYLVIALCLAATATVVLAAPPKATVSVAFPKTVYLDGAADLDKLRVANPRHYARVERILANADQLCKAGKLKLLAIDAQDMACYRSFIFTSYPPQRQLSFRIDDTRYIAMVFLQGAEGKLTPAQATPIRGSTAAVAVQGSPPPR